MLRRKRTENKIRNKAETVSCLSGMWKKAAGALLLLALLSGLSGCSAAVIPRRLFNVSTSYFNNYEAKGEGDYYLVSGTVHQAEDDNAVIVWAKAEKERTVPVKGYLRRRDGDIKLIYEAPDKTVTVLADSAQSDKDTIEIGTELKVGEGKGVIRFEGENAVFDFDVSLGGRMSGLKYLVSSDSDGDTADDAAGAEAGGSSDSGEPVGDSGKAKKEESVGRAEEERLIDSYSGTFTADSKSQTVLKFNFSEKTKVKLNAELSADQELSGTMTLGRFQLYYVSENGKKVTLLDHSETDHAMGGFHWESHYAEEIVFSEGVTEIVLSSVSGKNYFINLNIQVYEAEQP